MSVPSTLARLMADRDSGRLADLCAENDVDLLVLFGSARHDAARAHDIDVAYSARHGAAPRELDVVNALGAAYGDDLDIMSLDRAGVVARYEALCRGEVLVQLTAGKFALSQMAAFSEYCDTQKFRDLELARLAR